MLLDLKQIQFYIINLKTASAKRARMENQLQQLGLQYTFVDAIKTKPKCIGVALSHLKVLTNYGGTTPFAILEDDCIAYFDRFQYQLQLPDQADGLYLGHSTYGVKPNDKYGLQWGKNMTAQYRIYNDDYLRIHSMLARHALIYLSNSLSQDAILANKKALYHFAFPYPGDMAYVPLQKKYLMLATQQPWFYQNENAENSHLFTQHSLVDKIKPMNGEEEEVLQKLKTP